MRETFVQSLTTKILYFQKKGLNLNNDGVGTEKLLGNLAI